MAPIQGSNPSKPVPTATSKNAPCRDDMSARSEYIRARIGGEATSHDGRLLERCPGRFPSLGPAGECGDQLGVLSAQEILQ